MVVEVSKTQRADEDAALGPHHHGVPQGGGVAWPSDAVPWGRRRLGGGRRDAGLHELRACGHAAVLVVDEERGHRRRG